MLPFGEYLLINSQEGATMSQLHRRFSTDQAKMIFQLYEQKRLSLEECLEKLAVKKSRFFTLLSSYRKNPNKFNISYNRTKSNNRISPYVEKKIRSELEDEKKIIANPQIPVSCYNYSAIRDAVEKFTGEQVSVNSIINRAKDWGYYMIRPPRKAHDREVITTAIGMLIQHDSSHHLWSPFAVDKWSLITDIDDYSRKLLFADFFPEETTWAHIQAAEEVILKYGVGLAYYADSHSIFRFVCHRDSIWHKQVRGTDEVDTQWKRVVESCGMQVWHALSPQAKGKVERPYRWLQDRIVRRCAKEGIKNINDGRQILKEEVNRYNNHQVHSTTKEIPAIKFERAVREDRSCFKPLKLKEPITSTKDIFCLKEQRRVDGYHRISWQNQIFQVPKDIPVGSKVDLHIIPEQSNPELRLWYSNRLRQVYRLRP